MNLGGWSESGEVRRSRGCLWIGEVVGRGKKFNPRNIFDANQVVREPGKRISEVRELVSVLERAHFSDFGPNLPNFEVISVPFLPKKCPYEYSYCEGRLHTRHKI